MRTPFDQFCQRLLEEFLSSLGEVQLNLEVPGEPHSTDVWFMPFSQATVNEASLGLLGYLVRTPCLIELFRNPPSSTEIRNCLLKLLLVQADLQREARREDKHLPDDELPRLWILTPTASRFQLGRFGANPNVDWLFPSIYFMPPSLRTAIAVLNDLPPTSETLWLRLLGRGVTQQQAIHEVLALPRDCPHRATALRSLADWKIAIEVSGEIDEEDREVVMTLAEVYQELLEQEREAERRGIEQGAEREAKTLVLRQLNRRVGELPEPIRVQINALPLAQLESLGEALLDFTKLADLEAWLAEQG